ncbi:MAG: peptidoglycan DD-metalloendopeptidase family protein, partial [Oscillospiraceae bacterium]|nr:peptidoglycan DD-metalloendopeptidase family protein [Oscillospiraceae bacterium]
MMKRIVSFALALLMLCAMLPNFAMAANTIPDGKGPKEIEGGMRDFLWPVPGNYGLSGCFFDGRTPPHHAIDIPAVGGTPVVAAYDGKVIQAYNSGNGYGKLVLIEHDYQLATGEVIKLYSKYNHLKSYTVSSGKKVKAGDKVGTVGNTGGKYGYHLDFQILTSPDWRHLNYHNISIDPYVNELLELPEKIFCDSTPACCGVGPTGCCCYYYLEDVKKIYEKPIKTYTPDVPVLKISSDYTEQSPVTFAWSSDPNATHYNLYIDKKNPEGQYVNHETVETQGITVSRQLPAGEYRLQLTAYNIKAYVPEGSQRQYAVGEPVYMTIRCDHHYAETAKQAATCGKDGAITYTCSRCGDSYTEIVDATGDHDFGDWETVRSGGCTAPAVESQICARCGEVQYRVQEAAGHNFVEGRCDVCLEEAKEPVASGICGDDLTWRLDDNGILTLSGVGTMAEYPENTAPWLGDALPAVRVVVIGSGVTGISGGAFGACKKLEHVLYAGTETKWNALTMGADNEPLIKALRHYDASRTDVFELTVCNGEGLYCKLCNTFLNKTETTGDCSFVITKKVAPTCTEQGYTAYLCPGCEEGYADVETCVPALGHNFGAWVVQTPAQCDTDGVRRKECSRCGAFETEPVWATGHRYIAHSVAPSYTVPGGVRYICACGDYYEDADVPAKGLPVPQVTVQEDLALGAQFLTWEHDGEADYYEIHRSTSKSGNYLKVGTAKTNRWSDAKASAGKTYYYKVKAVCEAKFSLDSTYSDVVSITHKCAMIDLKVQNDLSTGKPKLTWDKISGAKKYEIRYSTDGGETFAGKTITTTKTSYVHSGAKGGTAYTYQVRALGSKSAYHGMYSPISQPCFVVCAAPSVSAKLDMTAGKVSLSWKAVAGVTEYAIFRSVNDGDLKVLGTVTETAFSDTDIAVDNRYSYQVVSLGAEPIFNSEPSAAKTVAYACGTTVLDGTVNDEGKPVLSWSAVEYAVSYEVYRSTKSGSGYKRIDGATTKELTYVDEDVAAGKTYYYKVIALGENTAGGYSNYKKLTGKCDIPELTVQTDTSGKPKLTWDKIPGAKKYEIKYSTDGGVTFAKKTITTTKTSYVHTGAVSGNAYTYQVRALGSKSAYHGLYSESSQPPCSVVCAAPSLTVKINSTTGNPELTWKKVSGASYYELYRAVNGGSFVSLDTTKDLKYTDDFAVADQKYSYYAVACGEKGKFRSIDSAVKTVTATCAQPNVTVTVDEVSGKPVLSWDAVEDAQGYAIYRATGTSASKFKKPITTVTGLTFTDPDVAASKTYYYKVAAIGSAGKEGTKSAYDKATGKCAKPEIQVQISETSGKPVISWDKIPGAKKYEIRYSTDGENFKKLTTTTKCSYTHTGAKVGTTYTYKVRGLGSRSSYDGQYSGCVSGGVTVFAQPAVTVQLSS